MPENKPSVSPSNFYVANHDAMTIAMIHEGGAFLLDQQTERKYVMGGVDIDLAIKEEYKMKKFEMEMLQKSKEDRKRKATEVATMVEHLYSTCSNTGFLKLTESDDSDTEDCPFERIQQSNTQMVTNS